MLTINTPREHRPTLWAEGFIFLEGPRWHSDRLWVSDVFDKKLFTLEQGGSRTLMAEVPRRPSGIGFLRDGTVVVASMQDRKIMRLVGAELSVHADFSELATGDLNDMLVDEEGRIYVGNFGYDFHGGAPKASTNVHRVEPDGAIHVAASGLEFPNGMAIINNGRTLVVAETWACKLSAFDRAPDGSLSNPRLFADLGNREPDGICADTSDGIWVACYNTGEVVRVLEGGEVTDRALCGRHVSACQLGGSDGTTLFCCAYVGTDEDLEAGKRLGAIFTISVDAPDVDFARP
ncbi:sugar lactone lactonase YvrE [Paraburkholderia sp. MM5496-R1]|uniref:SMP-30/gluconolactonase/LRE family protein n=1 Tax=Paraburkholderia sp. MM5496-R1 TaxID=2991065 RepID=UPI003D2008B7